MAPHSLLVVRLQAHHHHVAALSITLSQVLSKLAKSQQRACLPSSSSGLAMPAQYACLPAAAPGRLDTAATCRPPLIGLHFAGECRARPRGYECVPF
jgi:hypothetical protein